MQFSRPDQVLIFGTENDKNQHFPKAEKDDSFDQFWPCSAEITIKIVANLQILQNHAVFMLIWSADFEGSIC